MKQMNDRVLTHKEEEAIISFCRNYFLATEIPITFRVGKEQNRTLYNSQAECMKSFQYATNQNPNNELYFPPAPYPEFCGISPEIEYGRVHINGTEGDIFLGPVFPLGADEESLRKLMIEQAIPADEKEALWEFVMSIPPMPRSQLARHLMLLHQHFNHEEVSLEKIYQTGPFDPRTGQRVIQVDSPLPENRPEHTSIGMQETQGDAGHEGGESSGEERKKKSAGFLARVALLIASGNQSSLDHYLRHHRQEYLPGPMAAFRVRNEKNHFISSLSAICEFLVLEHKLDPVRSASLLELYIRRCEILQTREEILSLFYTTLYDLCELCMESEIPAGVTGDLERAIRYIRNHLNEPIRIQDLAAALNRSESYLMHAFKRELGMTAGQFLSRCRLEEARSLLAWTDWSLPQISNYLCYSSQAYFQNVFKRKYGITPAQYRKQTKAEKGQASMKVPSAHR